MSPFLSTLKTRGRAALIAVTLGAASLVAMPAPVMAQNFSFDFGISGGDSNFSFGIGRGGVRVKRDCLTNNEIRRGLSRAGWDDIRFLDRRGNRVSLIAEWRRNDRDYRMQINRCTGRVTDIEPLRRRGGGGGRGGSGGGFGLQFNFN